MNPGIKPALSLTEWHRHQCGAVSVSVVDDEKHVVVRDPDGEVVSLSGDDQLFGLLALANCAIADGDPRKLCRTDVAVLSVLIDEYHRSPGADIKIFTVANELLEKLAALLPASGDRMPRSGTGGPENHG